MNPRFLRFLAPAEQAQALADEHLVAMMPAVVGVAERRLGPLFADLDKKDVEAAYNLAWHGVWEMVARGEPIENLKALLVHITVLRSKDIHRTRHAEMHTDADLETQAVEVDLAEQADDRGKLMGLFERLKDRLNTNERKAVTLCILHGYSRAEAAKELGMPERKFQRIMDEAWKKVTSVAAGLDGRGCADGEWARALRSYALHLIDEDHPDYSKVAEHIEGCAPCRHYVRGLEGLAAVMPPLGFRFVPYGHHHPGIIHTAIEAVHRLFGGHGASAATGGGSTAGAAAAGAGTVKVAAIVVVSLAVVGGVSIHAATSSHHTHHTHRHSASAPGRAAVVTPPPAGAARIASNPSVGTAVPVIAHRKRHRQSSSTRATVVPAHLHTVEELGMEHTRTATPAKAIARAAGPSAPVATPTAKPSHSEPSESQSANRGEFTFEQK
ncbi:MAG TPA: sigma-70 family RNA polymerase sigma factor [Solirubrobacteraceae bacterium]|jgi:RNA polymerase sigma factor (sigma-70 family)